MAVNARGQFEQDYYIEDNVNIPKWIGSDADYKEYLEVIRKMTFEEDDAKRKDLKERYIALLKNWEYPNGN